MRRLFRLSLLPLSAFTCLGCPDQKAAVPPAPSATSRPAPAATPATERTADAGGEESAFSKLPAVAVWRRIGGYPIPGRPFQGPALRAAVWDDGRAIFAEDRRSWQGPLRQGQVDPESLKGLFREVAATGVFDLPGNTYLVPDAPVLVTLVRIAGREQILYWDEVEAKNYGINIQPKPHHLAFKKTWFAITRALDEHLPKESSPLLTAFAPPTNWYVKEAVQSE
jgi:hypothetical protein